MKSQAKLQASLDTFKVRYPGIVLILLIPLLLGGLRALEIGQATGGWIYDFATHYAVIHPTPNPHVLLIEDQLDNRLRGDDYWLTLLNELLATEAAQIVFTFMPKYTSEVFYETALKSGRVIFARGLEESRQQPGTHTLQSIPEGALRFVIPNSVIYLRPASTGVHRRQDMWVKTDQGILPTLEHAAARRLLKPSIALPDKSFLINFIGAPGLLPLLESTRVRQGQLVNSLARGRTLLVGFGKDVALPGITTAARHHDPSLSPLEFHGHALDALLTGLYVKELPLWGFILLLTVLSVCWLYIYQQLTLQLASWFALFAMVIQVTISWAFLSYFHIWLPLLEMLIILTIVLLTVFRYRAVIEESGLNEMLTELTATMQDRAIPDSFSNDDEHWEQITSMVSQTLEFNRMVFMDAMAGLHRVEIGKTWNCSEEDIDEPRRDFHREPFKTAIEANTPVKLGRPFITGGDPQNEQQYLVALHFAGEILGFWVFAVYKDVPRVSSDFMPAVKDFSSQIGEMLFRQREKTHGEEEKKPLRKYLTLQSSSQSHTSLKQAAGLLEQRLGVLESVFEGLGTATILYDIFGRVLQVNGQMEALMKQMNVAIRDLNALGLLTKLTGVDEAQARRFLQFVVMERGSVPLPIVLPTPNQSASVLTIRPLTRQADEITMGVDSTPFRLKGILFEVVDMSGAQGMMELKDQVAERFSERMQGELQSLVVALNMADDQELTAETRQELLSKAKEKVHSTVNFLGNTQQHLSANLFSRDVETYPVDAKAPVTEAIKQIQAVADTRNIEIHSRLPDLTSLVLAEPRGLLNLFLTVLKILVDDSLQGSHIQVDLVEWNNELLYSFENQGFGMKNDRLQEYLLGNLDNASGPFKELQEALTALKSWQGECTAKSELGQGMSFDIKLKGFI